MPYGYRSWNWFWSHTDPRTYSELKLILEHIPDQYRSWILSLIHTVPGIDLKVIKALEFVLNLHRSWKWPRNHIDIETNSEFINVLGLILSRYQSSNRYRIYSWKISQNHYESGTEGVIHISIRNSSSGTNPEPISILELIIFPWWLYNLRSTLIGLGTDLQLSGPNVIPIQ